MKVFTWEEVRRGYVPKRESFALVRDRSRNVLERNEGLYGGLILGSALLNQESVTSDVDALIMPNDRRSFYGMGNVFADLQKYAASLHVPLNITPLIQGDAECGEHTITPSFFLHLQYCTQKGGVIKNNFLDRILLNTNGSIVEDVRRVLIWKRRNLLRWFTNAPLEHSVVVDRLAKILSIAPHICLKMLYVHDSSYCESSAGALIHDYRKVYKGNALLDSLQLLTEARTHYQQLLLEDVSSQEYIAEVQSLYFVNLGITTTFLDANLDKLDKL